MSDISQIKLGTTVYEIKDKVSRQNMINKNTDSDVNAVVNFLNGLKVGGHNVISQATAEVTSIPSDSEPNVTVSVNPLGVAHFSFSIPKPKVTYISASFTNQLLSFDNPDAFSVEFVEDGVFLGANIEG